MREVWRSVWLTFGLVIGLAAVAEGSADFGTFLNSRGATPSAIGGTEKLACTQGTNTTYGCVISQVFAWFTSTSSTWTGIPAEPPCAPSTTTGTITLALTTPCANPVSGSGSPAYWQVTLTGNGVLAVTGGAVGAGFQLDVSEGSGPFTLTVPPGLYFPPSSLCTGAGAPVSYCTASGQLVLSGVANGKNMFYCRVRDITPTYWCGGVQSALAQTTPWTLVNTTNCVSINGCTTPSVNMTGADLIVGAVSVYPAGTVNITAMTDSASNTYTQAVANNQTTGTILKCYYHQFPTPVSGSLSFSATLTGSSPQPAISVAGFKGSIASPLDLAPTPTLSAGNVTSVQTPGGSTSASNELLVACLGNTTGGTTSGYSINGGYNIVAVNPAVAGASNGSALGWLVQSPIGAITAPTFSWTTSAQAVAGIMSYK